METRHAPFEILYQDDDVLAIDKRAGFFVHPPENSPFKIPNSRICLPLLRAYLRRPLVPVHRLDAATSGVLLWALTPQAASDMNRSFREGLVQKIYSAVVRGYVPEEFRVELPLESDSTGEPREARTDFRRLAQVEFAVAVGKKYPTSRYSWLESRPVTGRYHQIRRHLNRISHPIIGDTDHGDSHHNRFFRERLGISGLCLRATSIEIPHPRTGDTLRIEAKPSEQCEKIRRMFNGEISPF